MRGDGRVIRADGGEAHAFALDLADRESPPLSSKAAAGAVGDIEVLVSSAARNLPGAASTPTPGAFAELLAVNVSGAHGLVRALLPRAWSNAAAATSSS